MGECPTLWCSGNIMNLVFTSEEDRVGTVEILPLYPSSSCGHLRVLFTYIFQSEVDSDDVFEVRRDWFKERYGIITCLILTGISSSLVLVCLICLIGLMLFLFHVLVDTFLCL